MFTIRRLPEFDAWLTGLRDGATRIRLARRLGAAIVMTGGGDKSSQRVDITTAKTLAATLED